MRARLVGFWWVILFGLLCYGGYDLATQRLHRERRQLEQERTHIQLELTQIDQRLADMESQLGAYDDPAFLEVRLMARLGLVPKGQTKVVLRG